MSIIVKNAAATLFVAALLFYGVGCGKEKTEKTDAVKNREQIPTLHSTDMTTIISDSGVTRYRIYTKEMNRYDKGQEPYSEFPKGIHFERFDENLAVDANIHSDYARYYEHRKLWELKGKVRAINIQGDMFESERLFWNGNEKRIYSDTVVKITQQTRIINAINFDANESLTRYSFFQLHGPMVVKGEE